MGSGPSLINEGINWVLQALMRPANFKENAGVSDITTEHASFSCPYKYLPEGEGKPKKTTIKTNHGNCEPESEEQSAKLAFPLGGW